MPLPGEKPITQEDRTMVNEATITRLHEMKLSAMAASYRLQMEDNAIHKLSFDERFGLLVDTEWTTRKNNRLKRLIYQNSIQFLFKREIAFLSHACKTCCRENNMVEKRYPN